MHYKVASLDKGLIDAYLYWAQSKNKKSYGEINEYKRK